MKKFIAIVMASLIVLFAGCSTKTDSNATVIITDQIGRQVTLPQDVDKIVSCYYTATSTFIALDAVDKLVGIEIGADTRELYKEAAEVLLSLPAVGSGKSFNLEQTIALDPDVVIMPNRLSEYIESLEQAGIAVVVVNPESLEELLEMFELLGIISDQEENANELISFFNEKLDEINNLNLDATKKVYLSSNSSYLSSATTKMYQSFLVEQAGGIFVANDIEDGYWANISPEQLVAYNPDMILKVYGASYTTDEILNDERLSSINAVKNSEIYEIPSELEGWDYPTPSAILGVLWLSNKLHSDKYTDQMLEDSVKTFYNEFYGIEYWAK